jgi:hypothetical protein
VTTLDVIAETRAVEDLRAVEEIAIATLVAIGRTYDAAMAHVEFLATTRPRTMAPPVLALPRQVVDEPGLAGPAGAQVRFPAGAPAVGLAALRVSPLVEALQVMEARAEVPVASTEPTGDGTPDVDGLAADDADDADDEAPVCIEEAPLTGGTRAIVLAPAPEETQRVEARPAVASHAEAQHAEAQHAEAQPTVAELVTEIVEMPRHRDMAWAAGRHAEAETDQIPVQAA